MKRIQLTFLFLMLLRAFCAQDSSAKALKKSGISLNFTGRSQNLGIGVSALQCIITPRKIVFGLAEEVYFKKYKSEVYDAKVTNFSFIMPAYFGYQVSISKVKIMPSIGIFGAVAMQMVEFGNEDFASSTLFDWGPMGSLKIGYDFGKIILFADVRYYYNMDMKDWNGHFFKATPICIGVLAPKNKGQRRKSTSKNR